MLFGEPPPLLAAAQLVCFGHRFCDPADEELLHLSHPRVKPQKLNNQRTLGVEVLKVSGDVKQRSNFYMNRVLGPIGSFKLFYHSFPFTLAAFEPTLMHLRWYGASSARFDFAQSSESRQLGAFRFWRLVWAG